MTAPTVSIVLPTFNRARFLPAAFEAIRAQTYKRWDLIVVDDGGTDDTKAVVQALAARGESSNPVRYFYQENQGPGAARNHGIDQARGDLIAFFDSDDLWLPHHLETCVDALARHPEVDWVYAALRREEAHSGRVVVEHSFHDGGQPLPFLSFPCRRDGDLRVFEPQSLLLRAIQEPIYSSFQTSVYRRRVFTSLRLPPFRAGEDGAFVLLALAAGFRPAYFDRVHVVYRIHSDHTSAPGGRGGLDKRLAIMDSMQQAWEYVLTHAPLDRAQRRALRRRIAQWRFWQIGYALLWAGDRPRQALRAYRQGLTRWPWSARMWARYLASLALTILQRRPDKE